MVRKLPSSKFLLIESGLRLEFVIIVNRYEPVFRYRDFKSNRVVEIQIIRDYLLEVISYYFKCEHFNYID